MKTEIERVCEIMEMLLAHQPIIDVPYETINDIAVALVKEGYGDVKQAQIDVLNKVKTLIFQKDNPYNVPFEEFISANVFCGYIDELIKEVQNEN
jgi:hypothetical protein